MMDNPMLSRRPNPQQWWQKRTVTLIIAALGLIIILLVINVTIIKNEQHIANGQPVLIALAPVDPRSLMQGDYMTLRYALAGDILDASDSDHGLNDGYVIVKLDNNNVAQFVRLSDNHNRESLAANELPIYYRIRNNRVKLATNAFFFQEGHAKAFEAARYGLFWVNKNGQPLLTEMVDEDFTIIEGHSVDEKDENIAQ